jgi:hypothetical protein
MLPRSGVAKIAQRKINRRLVPIGMGGPLRGLGSTRSARRKHRIDPPARGGEDYPSHHVRHVRELARKSPAGAGPRSCRMLCARSAYPAAAAVRKAAVKSPPWATVEHPAIGPSGRSRSPPQAQPRPSEDEHRPHERKQAIIAPIGHFVFPRSSWPCSRSAAAH